MGFISTDLFFAILASISFALLFASSTYGFLANLILLVANIQLGLAATWYYDMFQGSTLSKLWFYEMAVSKEDYCAIVKEQLLAFNLGLLLPQLHTRPDNLELKDLNGEEDRMKKVFFTFGLFSWLLWFLVFQSQGSIYLLLGKRMIIVYALYQLSLAAPNDLPGVMSNRNFFLFGMITISEMISGMYGELITNLLLLGAVLIRLGLLSPWRRVVGFLVLFPVLIALQISKREIRERSWQGGENIIVSTTESLKSNLGDLDEIIDQEVVMFSLLARLNQGRITSHVLAWREKVHDNFEHSNRIWLAVKSAIIPRFLWRDKPKAGGEENIRLFTNVYKEGGTSMNIGYFADLFIAMGHYSFLGIFCFTYLCGLFFFRFCQFQNLSHLFFMATFFTTLVQIETDFFMMLNQIVKVFIAIFVLSLALKK